MEVAVDSRMPTYSGGLGVLAGLVDAKVRGLEHGEIAAALSKSVDAVKQTASRSLRRLRQAHALGH